MSLIPSYALIDSGAHYKLEQFGPYLISRPAPQAVSPRRLPHSMWDTSDATFSKEHAEGWTVNRKLPDNWTIDIEGLVFKLKLTDAGHLGIFPEQRILWQWIQQTILNAHINSPIQVLNLFGYSGGSTLAAAKSGAAVCHVDSSKSVVTLAKENQRLNSLDHAPIRWIIEDVSKFLRRELQRGTRYDAIILDPPSFGRGPSGEIFKIEKDLYALLDLCKELLSVQPLFILLSCHTPQFTPQILRELITRMMHNHNGIIEDGELTLSGRPDVPPLPCGTYARWKSNLLF